MLQPKHCENCAGGEKDRPLSNMVGEQTNCTPSGAGQIFEYYFKKWLLNKSNFDHSWVCSQNCNVGVSGASNLEAYRSVLDATPC